MGSNTAAMISSSRLQRGHRETSMAKIRFKSRAQLPEVTWLFGDFSAPCGPGDILRLRLPGTRITSSRRLKFGANTPLQHTNGHDRGSIKAISYSISSDGLNGMPMLPSFQEFLWDRCLRALGKPPGVSPPKPMAQTISAAS